MRLTLTLILFTFLLFVGYRLTGAAAAGLNSTAINALYPTGGSRSGMVPTQDPTADKQGVDATVGAWVAAFNNSDASAVGLLYTASAEIIDGDGQHVEGRDAIVNDFRETFSDCPGATIAVSIVSTRFVNSVTALVEGSATITCASGDTLETRPFSLVLVHENSNWLITSARDLTSQDAVPDSKLSDLEWLIGEWVDEGDECIVNLNYKWSENKKFILNDFTVQVDGQPAMSGTLRIGYDRAQNVIRSWVFDSEGGYGEGVWARQGTGQWVMKQTGVTSDGKPRSRTMIMSRMGNDRYTWESHDCTVNREVVADREPVTVVRKPAKSKD